MKFNKRLVVASLSTVMGLSIVGAISGTVAWYQYSTRATVSMVGTSVAESGLLQISKTGADGTWVRDLDGSATGSTNSNKLSPVTFGQLNNDGSLKSIAYTQPEAGKGAYSNWYTATKGKEYIQYDVYFRAVQKNPTNGNDTLVAKPVYLSDITMEDATANKIVSEALRIHLDIDGGQKILLSKSGVTDLALSGNLDLDGDGAIDTVGGYVFNNEHRNDPVTYGNDGEKQTAASISDWKVTRNGNGDFTDTSKAIFTTKATEAVKVTVTIWLEGWHQLTPDYSTLSEVKAIWDVQKSANATVNIGLTFDVGRNAFAN